MSPNSNQHPTPSYPLPYPALETQMKNQSSFIIKENNLFKSSFEGSDELDNKNFIKYMETNTHLPSRPPFNKQLTESGSSHLYYVLCISIEISK
jgi:hypothetical protein